LKASELATYIDHTLLKPQATEDQIKQLCQEAKQYGFASVCVNPVYVSLANTLLMGSDVKVCTVVGFPLGASLTSAKLFEAEQALVDGAREIDMVIAIGILKTENYFWVEKDIRKIVEACQKDQAIVKVIIETCLLTDEEKVKACNIAKAAGADFVKTSTGFLGEGATVADVKLMRETVGDSMGVKASGGIRSYEDAIAMIDAGASRIGASSGIKIVNGAPEE
jgi:deoxyribose-phosphate aldolase